MLKNARYGLQGIMAASVVSSKLDYCNSLYCLSNSRINRIHLISCRPVVKAPNICHTIPLLKFLGLHRLKVNPLTGTAHYSATSNNMKLVHWPLMGGLLHLV